MAEMENETQNPGDLYNCAQQVLVPLCDKFGLHHDLAIRIASNFGGGINCMGETCGAVTGALMVIGLKYGGTKEDKESNEIREKLVNDFIAQFQFRTGSIRCKELLGLDFSIPEEKTIIEEKKIPESRCPGFIDHSVKILSHLLNNA